MAPTTSPDQAIVKRFNEGKVSCTGVGGVGGVGGGVGRIIEEL